MITGAYITTAEEAADLVYAKLIEVDSLDVSLDTDTVTLMQGDKCFTAKLTEVEMPEVVRKIANAYVTYLRCGGHNKARRNRIAENRYRNEAELAGIKVPSNSVLEDIGVFNGEGST